MNATRHCWMGLVFAGLLAGCGGPALPPFEPTTELVYANPGWTHRDRQIYYYTPQGTELHGLRYSWFRELELASGNGRISDPEVLSRLGFLMDPHADPMVNPADLPIGFAHHGDPEGGDAFLDVTCAACHTGQLNYKGKAIRIDGGQAMHEVASTKPNTFGFLLVTALARTYLSPPDFDRFAERVLGVEYPKDKGKLRDDLGQVLQRFASEAWHGRNLYPTHDGFGRTDALGHIANAVFGDGLDYRNYREANAPVNYPHVWDIWKFDWVQWSGSSAQAMARNVGEALGVKAPFDMVGPFGSTLDPDKRFRSGVLVEELQCLESTLWHLQPPVWPEAGALPDLPPRGVLPEIDRPKAVKGAELFKRNCYRCHAPKRYRADEQPTLGKPFEWEMRLVSTTELGTDPLSAANFVQNRYDASTVDPSVPRLAEVSSPDALDIVTLGVMEKKYAELGVKPGSEKRWWLEGFGRRVQVQVKRAYKARPLHGIWATPPFLHNGSVPNLYQLLLPEEERDEKFWVGTREFDPKDVGYRTEEIPNGFLFDTSVPGNANTGHQFRDDGGAGVLGPAFTDGERYELVEFLKILGNTNPRYECLWRHPRQRDRRLCPERIWKAPRRPELLADPRHPEEIPPVRLPAEFLPPTEFAENGRLVLRDGLPAPQCSTGDPARPIQGPAALTLTALPLELPDALRLAREASAGIVRSYR